jgi:hypothetical protein
MEDIKTFAEVYQEMNEAYTNYLKTGEEDRLWELCHQVLSNALFILNEDDVEDVFTYEFPAEILANKTGIIYRLLNTNVGHITKVSTIPCEGYVWFNAEDGNDYNDDDRRLAIWEIFNIAVALYKMTEPLADELYKKI